MEPASLRTPLCWNLLILVDASGQVEGCSSQSPRAPGSRPSSGSSRQDRLPTWPPSMGGNGAPADLTHQGRVGESLGNRSHTFSASPSAAYLPCASSEIRMQGSGETERDCPGAATRRAVSDDRNTPGAGGCYTAVFVQMELVLRTPSCPPVLIRNVHAQKCPQFLRE